MPNRPIALVTGSASGVGRACAVRFAKEGFDVVVNYSRSEAEAQETVQLVTAAGAQVLLHQCDVSDDAAVRDMIAKVRERFGKLNVLVNNAATTYFIEHKNLDELTEEKWDRILDVNLKGPFFVTRAAVGLMRESGGGAVVNVSSVAGIAGSGSSIAYCASKGGLNTMTKSLARALAPDIRVNSVCPGPIDTRWMRAWKSEDEIVSMTSDYPIPRASLPEDIADVVYYLACGTKMTTGQLLPVDGGRTM